MADLVRPSHLRRRLATLAAATLVALVPPVAAAPSANADGGPVPDFNQDVPCSSGWSSLTMCWPEGSVTGGSRIVSWVWESPELLHRAEGQFPFMQFDGPGSVVEMTLTVTDDQDRTGSVTQPMVLQIG